MALCTFIKKTTHNDKVGAVHIYSSNTTQQTFFIQIWQNAELMVVVVFQTTALTLPGLVFQSFIGMVVSLKKRSNDLPRMENL